jgi:hypothetical protein
VPQYNVQGPPLKNKTQRQVLCQLCQLATQRQDPPFVACVGGSAKRREAVFPDRHTTSSHAKHGSGDPRPRANYVATSVGCSSSALIPGDYPHCGQRRKSDAKKDSANFIKPHPTKPSKRRQGLPILPLTSKSAKRGGGDRIAGGGHGKATERRREGKTPPSQQGRSPLPPSNPALPVLLAHYYRLPPTAIAYTMASSTAFLSIDSDARRGEEEEDAKRKRRYYFFSTCVSPHTQVWCGFGAYSTYKLPGSVTRVLERRGFVSR